jgi:outer membrane protein assembly factor BamB
VHNDVLVFGYSPPEGEDGGQGGVALLDVRSGAILANVPTVSPSDQAQGDAGGGIWSTAAFDNDGYAYVGAGNPFSKTQQAKTTDAILKIDVSPGRATFGQIVAAHQGEVDQYSDTLQQLSQSPACAASDTGMTWPLDDPACGQLDLDFGASPNLFPDGRGGLVVGDLQKSGLYHAVNTADMTAAWQTLVGASCAACNAASTAYDGHAVYVIGTPGAVLWALDPTNGSERWATPVADGAHYQALSTAEGVVYTVDGNGFLDAWAASDGTPLLKEPMAADAGAPVGGLTSTGVAIADGTVLATGADPTAQAAGDLTLPMHGYLIGYRSS